MEEYKGLPERVGKLEVKVEDHADLLKAQVEKNEALIRISLLMKQQQEDSKKRDERMEKISDTLDRVNANLASLTQGQENLNKNYDNLNNRLGVLETDIQDTKEGSKIDMNKLVKHVIFGVTLLVAGGLIMRWLGL